LNFTLSRNPKRTEKYYWLSWGVLLALAGLITINVLDIEINFSVLFVLFEIFILLTIIIAFKTAMRGEL